MVARDAPELTFDPRTIEHLGPKLYSKLPDAIAELVANAYDADAKAAIVTVRDDGDGNESIHVTDDGHGMTPYEVRSKYLRIGRDRRSDEGEYSRSGRRRVSGKKGLGKLALFGIGHTIRVATSGLEEPTRTSMALVWEDILGEDSGKYLPKTEYDDDYLGGAGTDIGVFDLQRKTEISADALARSLARLFTLTDETFKLFVERPDGTRIAVDAKLRREAYELDRSWSIPDDLPPDRFHELRAREVAGWIGYTKSTLRSDNRGVTVYANGRRATTPSFFDAQASNFAYAYIVGEISADFLDGLHPDVISTARNAINWEHPETLALRQDLSELAVFVATERRRARAERGEQTVSEASGIDRKRWIETLPHDVGTAVGKILDSVVDPDNEFQAGAQKRIIEGIYQVAPEYAELHWRRLHETLKSSLMETCYKEGRYDDALNAALHSVFVRIKSLLPHLAKEPNEGGLFDKAFSTTSTPRLEIVDIDGGHAGLGLSVETVKNFQVGTQSLAKGVVSGFRNPLSHDTGPTLYDAGILNREDCLDGLSALSHVARMIERARVVT